jgi:transposase
VLSLFFVGIDVAKSKHDISVLNNNGEVLFALPNVLNTTAGALRFLKALEKHGISAEDCIVGMEATGHYWLAFYSFLVNHGFDIKVINPIVTDGYRNMLVRKVKNDNIDSQIIAKVLMLGAYQESPVADGQMVALRQLCRFRAYEVDSCSDLKRKAIALLDQIFPEFASFFSDTFGVTAREILMNYTTPEELTQISTTKLTNLLAKVSRGRFGRAKAEELKAAASSSLGITIAADAFAFQLKQILAQIKFIEDQVAHLDGQIANYMERSASYITTIPGVGPVLGAVIISEIGNVTRFSVPSKLVAYAGLDASVKQSGNFEGSQMHMSKRGSPYLRRAIFTAANVASFHDPTLSAYYQKLKARGKHHNVAVGAVARKLTYIIHAVMTEKRPFEVR